MRGSIAAGAALVAALAATAAVAATFTGPSSSQSPYVIPVDPSVSTASILTVGDSVNNDPALPAVPYRMVGIPDGLGAFDNGNGTFTVLMNHELAQTLGRVRAHGATGAFVSKWTIQKRTLRVLRGEDLIQRVALAPGGVYAPPAKGVVLGRFCSGNLAELSAFYNRRTGKGFRGRLYMNGEEVGNEGRAFAHALDGTSYELPAVGKMSFENVVANAGTRDKTVVALTDDSTPGQVYVYVGEKQRTGNPAEQAGLTGGKLYGVKVPTVPTETDATFPAPGARFELVDLGNAAAKTGTQLEADSNAQQVTRWQRPEDNSWDPRRPRDLYFVTTASPTNRSRLWRLRFDDASNPAAGGTVDMLLDGTEGQIMFDNITVDRHGRVLLQEDPGNHPRLARIYGYTIKTDTLTELAEHDPVRFSPTTNQDEESSGIIPMDGILGPGIYLFDEQWHSQKQDAELVEGGQLQALYWPLARGDHEDDDDQGEDDEDQGDGD